MEKVSKILSNLAQFNGSDRFYKHQSGTIYTEGVQYLAKSADAYWLLDLVASHCKYNEDVKGHYFQVYDLFVKDNSAKVVITDGNHNILGKQEIEYTDFPLNKFVLWCVHNTIMLPSEY